MGNILFHSVPYTQTSKDALAYEEYNKLGTSASMGCIRLSVEDAKWLYDYCAAGTLVTIYEDEDPGPLGKPEPLAIDVDSPNRGWDPTDPDPENPWLLEMAEVPLLRNRPSPVKRLSVMPFLLEDVGNLPNLRGTD